MIDAAAELHHDGVGGPGYTITSEVDELGFSVPWKELFRQEALA